MAHTDTLYGRTVTVKPAVAVKLTHAQARFRTARGTVKEILPNGWVLVQWRGIVGRTPFHQDELETA